MRFWILFKSSVLVGFFWHHLLGKEWCCLVTVRCSGSSSRDLFWDVRGWRGLLLTDRMKSPDSSLGLLDTTPAGERWGTGVPHPICVRAKSRPPTQPPLIGLWVEPQFFLWPLLQWGNYCLQVFSLARDSHPLAGKVYICFMVYTCWHFCVVSLSSI